ncbi:MAG TPA: hypothetical protein VNV42_03420 [Solirubrobacteraceae bacterium]|jgi:hypothetical protein|nr:hypothetical protein [Solirubrobacteraceae bacterium]
MRVVGIAVWSRLVAVVFGVCLLGVCAGSAAAEIGPAAGYSIRALAEPSILSADFNGNNPESDPNAFQVTVTNTGSRPTDGSPIVIRDELPAGVTAISVHADVGGTGTGLTGEAKYPSPIACETSTVQCVYNGSLLPSQNLLMLVVVTVAPGKTGSVVDSAIVSGGGVSSASTNTVAQIGTAAESLAEPFGLASVTAEATGVNGLTDQQAGDHPYETTISFTLNSITKLNEFHSAGGGREGDAKDVVVETPPGFTGDPTVVERCPQYKVVAASCPASTQVGFARLSLVSRTAEPGEAYSWALPVYNVVPDKGYPAEFAIDIPSPQLVIPLYVTVSPESHYGVRVITPDTAGIGNPLEVSVTFFGTPSRDSSTYDEYRKAVTGAAPLAFLDNPVDCSTAPQVTTVSVDSWQNPGPWLADGQPDLSDPRWVSKSSTMFPSLTGCELLQFNASLSVTPDTTQADEPAGTTVELHLPQAPQQLPGLVSPEFKETTVTLPSGLSLSPSAGDGLEGCTNAQISLEMAGPGSCPNGSQIGTLTATSPLLAEPLQGKVFLGTPYCDPCTNADAYDGNMYRLFLQIEGSGVVVKLEGRIFANPTTGQLTTTFKDIPQLPTSDVQLHFNSGLRAGLATPQSCGTFTSTADLTPWSTPITPDATPTSQFNVDWNGDGEACPPIWPFHPVFEAGTSNANAGQLTPLTVTFNREDREQDFSQIKVTTPPGLLGSLSGIPLCGEPQADLGTCSAASQIGEMTVAAGPGSHPYYQKGMVYLTGPYKGAPFGLSIVVPTRAGPFNLGNVVVRARINVDPNTTALTVTTDPLPQILDGIPLRLRKTNVTINRPGFIFNPTNCAQQKITAVVSGSQGTQTEVSTPFAVAGCAGLSFGPKFSVSVSGKSSRLEGTSLDAKVLFPSGPQSNIAHVRVELPRDLPSRLQTLQKACPAATFESDPAACPPASVIGATQAITPILPVPLRGPVYFVSHGGEAFPNLVAVLQGYGVRVNLVGDTFISKAGITSTTFTNVPDVQVSSFELFLPKGPFSALTALGNLCKEKLVMPTQFIAQDGARVEQGTPIAVTGCSKGKKTSRHARASQHGHTSRLERRSGR